MRILLPFPLLPFPSPPLLCSVAGGKSTDILDDRLAVVPLHELGARHLLRISAEKALVDLRPVVPLQLGIVTVEHVEDELVALQEQGLVGVAEAGKTREVRLYLDVE